MNPEDIQKIAQIAIDIDHNSSFGGKSLGNQHLFRVVKIAKFFAKKLNADLEVVEAAAYLHDAALPTENDDDYVENKKLIKKIFSESGVKANEDFIEKVAEAAASHEGTVVPKTLEAKIIHDSDVIEKTGLLGIIRHTWKLTNQKKINPENVTDEDIRNVVEHIKWRKSILQTDVAIEMSEKNGVLPDEEDIKKLVPFISKLAFDGVITEIIAKKIEPMISDKQKSSLSNQLNLDYLN